MLLLDANLAMTPTSVNGLVALDNSQRSKMSLVTTILPLVTGIAGLILLIVGILLSRRREDVEDVEGGASATSPELAAAEPEDTDDSAQSVTQPSLVPGLDDESTAESPAAQLEAVQAESESAEAPEAEAAQPEAAQAESESAEAPEAESAGAPTAARPLSLAPQPQQQVPGEELPQHGHAEQRPGPVG